MCDENHNPPRPVLLAQMPNGESFRADIIDAVRIVEDETLIDSDLMRFAVILHFADKQTHCIGARLKAREAKTFAEQATQEINAKRTALP